MRQTFYKGRDDRPRIHIWPARDGSAHWSVGPLGLRHEGLSPGYALDTCIETLGHKPMVVILEPLP